MPTVNKTLVVRPTPNWTPLPDDAPQWAIEERKALDAHFKEIEQVLKALQNQKQNK